MASRQASTIGRPLTPVQSVSIFMKHVGETKRHSNAKRKEKAGSEVEVKDKLRSVELDKFCPQKIFNVLFINETDDYSKEMANKIIETSREFAEISYLTFITYDEVVDLVKNCDNVVLPPLITSLLKTLSKKATDSLKQEQTIPLDSLAQLMKLKLIEVMYTNYVNAVKKMQKRRKLMADLKTLADECRQDRYREKSKKSLDSKTNVSKTSKSDLIKKGKTQQAAKEVEIVDYTTIPIQNDDDIIFDDDIHHHVSFYIFSGFSDPAILKELIVHNNVHVQSIIKFTAQKDGNEEKSDTTTHSNFWDKISKDFDGPERQAYTENTFLMTYTATDSNMKRILEEMLYVVRSIFDIKMQHLNYVRHMEVFHDKETYNHFPLECFTVYNNFLHKIPFELVNIPVLLDSLLKQVCVSVDETLTFSENISQHSYLETNTFEKGGCINPCSFEAFLKRKNKNMPEPTVLRKPETSYLVHENDDLPLILKSYKKYGPLVHDITMKMLKQIKLLKDFNEYDADCTEIIHKHDRDPSTKTVIKDKDIILHFLYLFLFTCFGYKAVLPKLDDSELVKHLEAYQKLNFINYSQPIIIKPDITNEEQEGEEKTTSENNDKDEEGDVAPVQELQDDNKTREDNLYDTAATQYFWKERLEDTILLQELFKAHKEYLYCDYRYSPETDTLLVQFSNGLDEFGINTKVYDQPLLTTVCLRDFCRYDIVHQADWLKANKPPKYVRKCVVKEVCQGAQKVTNLSLFPEYHYLLDTEIQKIIESDKRNQNIDTTDFEEITFDQLVNEIKNYPLNNKIVKECGKYDKQKVLVYDLGTRYFHVKGAKTTFQSHDDVTVSVDNTKLLEEDPKCSVTLTCRNNSFTLHSNKFYATQDYDFHMHLADGTIISYAFFKHKRMKHAKGQPKEMKAHESQTSKRSLSLETETYIVDMDLEEIVRSVDRDYFDSVNKTCLLNEEFDDSQQVIFKPSESILDRLKEATTTNVPIYKVNNNLTYLKKLKSEFEIPLSNIIKRVLHTTSCKEEIQATTKRYLPVEEPTHESEKASDVRIALPNGLYISFYPSKLKKGYLEVKQEFLNHNEPTEQEEFRLFTRGGYNLVKRIDGCIATLKSNGDFIKHEKFNSKDAEKWHIGPCHCKTIQDYVKRVNKMLKYADGEVSDVAVSRRAHLHTKKGNIVRPDVIQILVDSKLPYLKNTSLKFDGSRVCLESGKIRVKKVLHVSFENNFTEGEVYYERSDGFRSSFDKNGSLMVEFVDGTKITSSVHVSKNLADGYVYISLEFKFEHPNYATVFYTADNALEIHLNNNVVFRQDVENSSVRIDKDIVTTIDKNRVLFEKTCGECSSKYTCNFNIHPLVRGKISLSDTFLHAHDSYNKHFYSDYAGNCERNDDYIKEPFNSFNCNHYSHMSYKKFFVVNRNFSGEQFWTDNMVLTKKKTKLKEPDTTFKECSDCNNANVKVYKFKRQIFDHYTSRFLNRNLLSPKDDKEVIYITFSIIKRILDNGSLQKFYEDLEQFFSRPENSSSTSGNKYCNVLGRMIEGNKVYCQRKNEYVVETKQVTVQSEYCKCVQEKMSIADKIDNWKTECRKYRKLLRNPKIPCYFESPFCMIIKKK